MRHNEIVVNEVESIEGGGVSQVLRCMGRVRQVVLGEEADSEEMIKDEIRNVVYHMYDYQCFQQDMEEEDNSFDREVS